MELQGQVIQELEPVTGQGQNGDWKKQTFILQTTGQYPKKVAFEVFNDKIQVQVGTNVTVGVNPESREYNSRWYTSLTAWNIKVESQRAIPQPPPSPEYIQPDEEGDDLPF